MNRNRRFLSRSLWSTWLPSTPFGEFARLPMLKALAYGALCSLLCSTGCHQPGQPAVQSEENQIEAAHGVPSHKPKSFRQAVGELDTRFPKIREARETGRQDVAQAELQQLLDIVRWLPELAGDSDLRRADWELVQRQSADLEVQVRSWGHLSEPLSDEKEARFTQLVRELAPLIQKSEFSRNAMSQTDDLTPGNSPAASDTTP